MTMWFDDIGNRLTGDHVGVKADIDKVSSALCWSEVDTEDSWNDRTQVVVHGRAGRVRHRHLQVAISSRIRIDCSHTSSTRVVTFYQIKSNLYTLKLYRSQRRMRKSE